jgi:uncharacterized membrane protein
MPWLVLGLVAFLATHSLRLLAPAWREAQVRRLGAARWKALHGAASIATFALLVWGYGQARAGTPLLWEPPAGMAHVAAILVMIAFVLFAAAYVPGNRIKAMVGHPMLLGVQVWAVAHLLANGGLAQVVLFGSFFVWALLAFRAARARDQAAGTTYPVLGLGRDVAAVVIGILAWGVFAHLLHYLLIGVRPLG